MENDAICSQQSALLRAERANTRKRAAEIEAVRKTAAAKAAVGAADANHAKKRSKKRGPKQETRKGATATKWWETSGPLSDTFQLTLQEDDMDDVAITDEQRRIVEEKGSLQVQVYVQNIIHTCIENILLRQQGEQ